MKYLVFLIAIIIKPAFSINDLEGKVLICSYGKSKLIMTYIFFIKIVMLQNIYF